MNGSLPRLILQPPTAGWWPFDVEWQGRRYEQTASCVPHDSFVELIVWLEAIWLAQLPAVWFNNQEQTQWPFLAEAAEAGQLELTLHEPTFPYDLAAKDAYGVLVQGVIDARAFVASWYGTLRAAWDSEFFSVDEWDLDLRLLDCSRLEALLAGAEAQAAWLADYADDKVRAERSFRLAQQIWDRMAAQYKREQGAAQ